MKKELFQSVNPATEAILATFDEHTPKEVEARLERAREGFLHWRESPVSRRCDRLTSLAGLLRKRRAELAKRITLEMGKPIGEAEAEIEKCALGCEYSASHAESFLAPEELPSSATRSYVEFAPLGPLLAIMPWNFPFWQVIRFAAAAVAAGNVVLLKHAPNVPQCALSLRDLFREAEFPPGVFESLFVTTETTGRVMQDPRIAGVTLTGSTRAGREVAAAAGRAIKKSVLELGGSDPFLVLSSARLEEAVTAGVRSRFLNSGQSCLAAKRFIVEDSVYDEFRERFVEEVKRLRVGDPLDRDTQVGPLARRDLRDTLSRQIRESEADGARILVGGKPLKRRGWYFQATVLEADPGPSAVCREEVFGPAAVLFRVENPEQAVRLANNTAYGLGVSLWTQHEQEALHWAGQIEAGQVFINGIVASDPRLPFGGVKQSGYGRELSRLGLLEFVNIRTVWWGPERS